MSEQSMAILILLGSFLVMIFLRFPIAYAVAISSMLTLLYEGLPLTTIAQQMVKGISSFSLMAVPFFITMGVLMGSGGISDKLIALANSFVGWMRGGLAMVNIVASYFFGGISGSAAADTASLGSILIPMMVDEGYDADFSTAVTITSSVEGLLVPPSHNMVIYATTAGGISVGSLFLAGYMPGAILAVSLMVMSYIISVKRNYPKGDKFNLMSLLKQLLTSFWALAAVLIVVFGVVGGVFTATESAAIAVIYSLIVSVFIYKGLDWKGVWNALGDCVNTLSIVMILISTSSIFGFMLTRLHVPTLASNAIIGLTDNPIIIALLLNVLLLVLGMIMDMAPIILIATPILLPIAVSIGLTPIQFGIMVILNCGIGLLTPPVGAVLFIGSAVSKQPMEKIVKATLPFYVAMLITLLLITFIPAISLWLPSLFAK
ncbi:TRAP transporter large permease [Proteiniclasticum sp. SCR006]|uniref:TRAP transporter large permease n=1 Tax=Proteiniclasticum aestuarii TaxID=2817862 RepID=A0A939H9X9_9CLOT|nr:TRAP transporter large permease [Proteiniclasticum aestuarii]MBO1265234.1 TRAP transporter large permease [Proteiniclasticum aestuarii]